MHVISAMNKALQAFIPGQVGRFDDSFNINCVSIRFSSLCPRFYLRRVISGDNQREQTRSFIFIVFTFRLAASKRKRYS
jgi:hypothetical protein